MNDMEVKRKCPGRSLVTEFGVLWDGKHCCWAAVLRLATASPAAGMCHLLLLSLAPLG